MKDLYQDPQVREFLSHFKREGLPALMSSGMMIALVNAEPDPKMCLEIGAAVLLDKPIVVCVPQGIPVPENLRKCATRIIPMGPNGELTEEFKGQLEDAMYDVTSAVKSKSPESA
jgi:hypothetical protein